MKRSIILALFVALGASFLAAVELNLGVTYGGRSTTGDIKEVYGGGAVYFPYVGVNVYKGLSLGIGYEGGYDRSGKIGLYQESTNLRISGYEVFAAYNFPLKKFTPYVRLGFGSYSYKQTVESPSAQKVDDSKAAFTVGAGASYKFYKGFFVSADIKYVPLKVKPLEEEVDLGGFRYALGVGYSFQL